MSGAKQNAQSSAQDSEFRDGRRLIVVSRELELIAAGTPSPTAAYLEEELSIFSKTANGIRTILNQK
jgi:hypothetical protein